MAPTEQAPAVDVATAPERSGLRADDPRLFAWRAFLRTHNHLMRRLSQDLGDAGQIDLATYDVLLQLAQAPDNKLRMAELADAVLISRSGLTRMIDRMQREGLVERERDPNDKRGLYTVMTPTGRAALKAASPVHLAGVSELVIDKLTPDELDALERLMTKLDTRSSTDVDNCGIDVDID